MSALDIELNKSLLAGNGDKTTVQKRDYVEITIPVPKIEHNSSLNNNNELQIISNNTTSVNRILVNGPKSITTQTSASATTTTSTKPHRLIATRRHRSLYVIPKQRPVIRENILEMETLNGGKSHAAVTPSDVPKTITGSEKTIDTLSSESTKDLQTNNETVTKDNKSNQNDVS